VRHEPWRGPDARKHKRSLLILNQDGKLQYANSKEILLSSADIQVRKAWACGSNVGGAAHLL